MTLGPSHNIAQLFDCIHDGSNSKCMHDLCKVFWFILRADKALYKTEIKVRACKKY